MSQTISIDEDDVQTLVELGLNSPQAKIYLTLISLQIANAKKIAQTTKIDSGEVYRQLENLEKIGLVEKILKFPNEYAPIPLTETLKLLIKQKNKENLSLQKRAQKLLLKNDKAIVYEPKDFRFSVFPESRFTFEYLTKAHKEVQKESLWYTQIDNLPPEIEKNHEFWDKNTNKNARLRALAELRGCSDRIL
jgi:DNA-binding MarR family transcriptional regulator